MTELKGELAEYVKHYKDEPLINLGLAYIFREKCWYDSLLKEHRCLFENSDRLTAFGDRCVQYLFKLLVEQMPNNFSVLEVGVNKSQILSLIQMIATKENKTTKIVGVTPLCDPDFDNGRNRLPDIEYVYKTLNITMENTSLIDGRSQNPKIVEKVKEMGLFDIMFIDGDHSYSGAAFDMLTYTKFMKVGSFLVIDDTNDFKNFPKDIFDPIHGRETIFQGLIGVSKATRDTLEKDDTLQEILTVMHTRLFRKVK
jgi:hypothetical protein